VFPLTAVPLSVGQPRSVRLVDDVMRGNRLLALVAQRDPKVEPATPADLHRMGTVGVIHQLARVPDGSMRLMVQGIERIRLLDWVTAKLRRLVDLLQRELAVRELGRKITTDTEERLSKQQREFYLREQLRSIQRELGETDGGDNQVAELRRRIEEARLPEEAR